MTRRQQQEKQKLWAEVFAAWEEVSSNNKIVVPRGSEKVKEYSRLMNAYYSKYNTPPDYDHSGFRHWLTSTKEAAARDAAQRMKNIEELPAATDEDIAEVGFEDKIRRVGEGHNDIEL